MLAVLKTPTVTMYRAKRKRLAPGLGAIATSSPLSHVRVGGSAWGGGGRGGAPEKKRDFFFGEPNEATGYVPYHEK